MLRVGKIEYINTIPVYYGFIKGKVKAPQCVFDEDIPSELNRKLREGKLDISVVSSYEYMLNSKMYILIPEISISSKGKVMSVLFLSQLPMHQLHRKDVWLTKSSTTSRAFIEYLLKKRYGVEPNYKYYSLKEGELPKNVTAVLSIGDDAFKLASYRRFRFIYDLGQEWFEMFKLPFVFALWAVRKEVYETSKSLVLDFCKSLAASKKEGLKNLLAICKEFGRRVGISQTNCLQYYKYLNYNLGKDHLKSLKIFSKLVNLNPEFKFVEL